MDRDAEALQRHLLQLVQDLLPSASMEDVEAMKQAIEHQNTENHSLDAIAHSDEQETQSGVSDHDPLQHRSFQKDPLLELGDIPAVQDRFHAVLKRRLQSEIQRNPPLFPWETELHDYETEESTYAAFHSSPTAPEFSVVPTDGTRLNRLWLSQIKTFNLPISLPEDLLAELLQHCQDVVQSSLREGAKLVRAVEDLFPGQSQSLNYLAGLVLTSPARSKEATVTSLGANSPRSYEVAVPAQQMVLSLLAAREILNTLTLAVSSAQPRVERQWLTELGALSLEAAYDGTSTTGKLRIDGRLPCAGSLTLSGNGVQATAQRSTGGGLGVELCDLDLNQTCVLDIRLVGQEHLPLRFAVQITSDPLKF